MRPKRASGLNRIGASVLIAAALLCAVEAPATRRTRETDSYVQHPEQVTPGVHVLRLPTQFIDPTGNVTIIEQSDGLIVVDGGDSFGAGMRVVARVKAISPKPVKAIVLTHYHSDHSFGMSALLKAWPNADFVASRGTYQAMAEGRPPGAPRKPSKAFENRKIDRLKLAFAANQREFANAKSREERTGWAREFSSLDRRVADFPGTYTILPRHVFDDRLDFDDPVTPVQILFLGRANTPGDTLLWLPKQAILVTGDVVVAPIPYMFDVYPAEMLQVFGRIDALKPRILVPGHGPIQQPAYLRMIGDMVRDVRALVAPLARRNVPLEQVQEQVDGKRWRKQFAQNDPWLGFWFDNYAFAPLVDSSFHEARGDRLGPPPVTPP